MAVGATSRHGQLQDEEASDDRSRTLLFLAGGWSGQCHSIDKRRNRVPPASKTDRQLCTAAHNDRCCLPMFGGLASSRPSASVAPRQNGAVASKPSRFSRALLRLRLDWVNVWQIENRQLRSVPLAPARPRAGYPASVPCRPSLLLRRCKLLNQH